MGDFRMPALGAEMTEGRLVEWLVKPGDTVQRGDIVAVVETDKAAIEVEIWEDGTIGELLVEEGTKVPVGTPLARLGTTEPPPVPHVQGPLARHRARELGVDLGVIQGTGIGGTITRHDVELAAHPTAEPGGGARMPPTPASSAAFPSEGVGDESRPLASPYARRLAAERGIDASTLDGSGPRGAVVARDLDRERDGETAKGEPEAGARPVEQGTRDVPEKDEVSSEGGATALRQAIARAMARANRDIPHYYLGTQVDVTDTMAWLTEWNEGRPPQERTLLAAIQLKAVALALREHPELNGYWIEDRFEAADSIDVGVAIALRGGGLIAPAIVRTDTLELDELTTRLRDLVRRTRAGRLRASEASSATMTVTNLGDLGVETVYGVITPPQVALVGFGRPVERPWAVEGMLAVRSIIHLTLAADHRQTDGAVGARFLTDVEQLLRRPEDL